MDTRPQNNRDDNTVQELTGVIVPEEKRLAFLPKHLGNHFFHFEMAVYDWMERLTSDYRGGYWHFYDLTNGGLYMAPKTDTQFRMVNALNYFDDTMSADAAGVAVCCFALCILSHKYPSFKSFAEKFYLVRDYALVHPEASKIIRLID